jgi:hypothetical protein
VISKDCWNGRIQFKKKNQLSQQNVDVGYGGQIQKEGKSILKRVEQGGKVRGN